MNGRVYDPVLGRFLSADPFVDDAGDSQSYNRYSYVSNNPLGYTDPSGYIKFKDVLKIAAVVVAAYFTAGWAISAWGVSSAGVAGSAFAGGLQAAGFSAGVINGIIGGAAAGFASGFSGSLLNGGSIGDAFKAGVIGGLAGAVTGGFLGHIGGTNMNWFERGLSHGLVHGGVAEATGGEFRHGFYAGFAVGATEARIGKWADGSKARGVAAAAVVGGTASALGGGKFANGAISGAFSYLFNAESQLPSDQQGASVDVGFYDSADKGSFINSLASHEDFKAGAESRSTLAVGVANEKELVQWLKNNPGKVDSIGFFGHGNSDGIYINGKAVSASTIKLMANHLSPSGKAYFFACEVGAAGGGTPSAWARKYFYQGQTIYAAKDLIKYTKEYRAGGPVHTGRMHTDGDYLWMWSYTGGKKP